MLVQKEEAMANATKIRLMAEAEANRKKLTPEYLQLEAIKVVAKSSKVWRGHKGTHT